MRSLVIILLVGSALQSADGPAVALQDQIRKAIDAAEPSVAAIIVSSNPAYPALSDDEKALPGRLGDYRANPKRTDGIVQPERDKLDLSDARNAADNLFGSGVVLAEDGRLLTNFHLVAAARKIYIRYSDGRGTYADIHAADARSDLAVLRPINPMPGCRAVKFATVRLQDDGAEKATVFRGQFVLALAHPFAAGFLDGKPSASWGLLSNVRRRGPVTGNEESRQGVLHSYANLLQTDARLNLGASGGALLNLDGELIGLLSATAAVAGSEASGGYALPMDAIYRRIAEVLLEGREVEYGFLGIVPNTGRTKTGLTVASISPNTPAREAGLAENDVILTVDGRPLRELEDLYLLVGGSLAGTEVTMDVQRGNRRVTIKPRLSKFVHAHASIASQRPAAVFGLRVEYVSVLQQMVALGEPRVNRGGVTIRELEPGTPAAEKLKTMLGGRPMLISAVNGTPVANPPEFYAAAKDATTVRLTIVNAADPADPGRTVTLP